MALDVRRDQVTLTPPERSRYKAALFAMKRMPLTRDRLAPTATDPSVYSPDPPTDGSLNAPRNAYDQYVHWHDRGSASPTVIHRTPMFLPWHRWFIRLFEMDLKRADYLLYNPSSGPQPPQPPPGQPAPGGIVLPYWDFCRQIDRVPVANQLRVPWSADFLGAFPTTSGGIASPFEFPVGYVPGDFSDPTVWPIYFPQYGARVFDRAGVLGRLTRRIADDTTVPLNGLEYAMRVVGERPAESGSSATITSYDSSPWDIGVAARDSFRNALEGWNTLSGVSTTLGGAQMHNRAHMWIGGLMSVAPIAANDPAFFLVHANVDRYWRKWQHLSVQAGGAPAQYPPLAGYSLPRANIDADMMPWEAGQPHHAEFGKVVGDTLNSEVLGPTTFGSGWTSVPQTDGYRYDREPWNQPVVRRP